jgi:hypothetical protein
VSPQRECSARGGPNCSASAGCAGSASLTVPSALPTVGASRSTAVCDVNAVTRDPHAAHGTSSHAPTRAGTATAAVQHDTGVTTAGTATARPTDCCPRILRSTVHAPHQWKRFVHQTGRCKASCRPSAEVRKFLAASDARVSDARLGVGGQGGTLRSTPAPLTPSVQGNATRRAGTTSPHGTGERARDYRHALPHTNHSTRHRASSEGHSRISNLSSTK